jgi:hypothetical protein
MEIHRGPIVRAARCPPSVQCGSRKTAMPSAAAEAPAGGCWSIVSQQRRTESTEGCVAGFVVKAGLRGPPPGHCSPVTLLRRWMPTGPACGPDLGTGAQSPIEDGPNCLARNACWHRRRSRTRSSGHRPPEPVRWQDGRLGDRRRLNRDAASVLRELLAASHTISRGARIAASGALMARNACGLSWQVRPTTSVR